ncbi:hypothetical protein [Candidatus Poriferisocius sp.]|uniref:hypothetical protein n=1 Tax=Candidatus Poriferisocius sp. TaxID=3101276 RepID=UPI003B02EA8E
MNERKALEQRIDALSPMGIRYVTRMVDSLADPPRALLAEPVPTWLTAEPDWIEYFSLMISAHHGVTVDALGLGSFESAFRDTCEAVGWTLHPLGSATQRFVDTTVTAADGHVRKLSLKSTAAQRLSNTSTHISKLTEAAWIQDVRSARARQAKTLELFKEYCAAVDAILMLRAFRASRAITPYRYQLIEIPTAIFESLADAPLSAFEADGPTINCAYGENSAAARVSLDRSDAKVTVKQIQLSACDVHAEWELQHS